MDNVSESLISIIIPVYNQECYLNRCLDSVINQDYSKLQIIVVDDGSTDRSGLICDEYSKKDDRVIVIHKANGGLSSARNEGLEVVKGEFVAFVDSDDWIEKDMISYLYHGLVENNVDISICGHYNNRPRNSRVEHYPKEVCLDSIIAIQWLVEDNYIRNYMWNKLFKTELFEEVRFPLRMAFEDVGVTYKLFLKSKKILIRPQPKYHYVTNKGSIVHTLTLKKLLDVMILIEKRFEDTMDVCPPKYHYHFFDSCYQLFLFVYLKNNAAINELDRSEVDRVMIQFVIDNYDTLILPNSNMITRKIYGEIVRKRSLDIEPYLSIMAKACASFNSNFRAMMRRIRG